MSCMDQERVKPKLSIVAATRNDNHGGDMNKRMQLFIDGLFEQSEKYKFPIEIILVDWNPPEGADPLSRAISWDKQGRRSIVRIIEVPNEIHRAYANAEKLPLFQMIGKNVGIRRASADFILATNVDIIFSDEIIEYLATADLEKNKIYRANRIDIDNQVPVEADNDEKLRYCKDNIIRIPTKYHNESLLTNKKYYLYEPDVIDICERHNFDCLLYTNACGDFQLLSKENWLDLHGYPEFDMYSMHLDSVFAYMAFYRGITEETVGDVYHMEHDSGCKPDDKIDIVVRMKRKGISCLTYEQLLAFLIQMNRNEISPVFNTDKWGLSGIILNESVIEGKSVTLLENRNNSLSFNPNDVCDTAYWIKHLKKFLRVASYKKEKDFASFMRNRMLRSLIMFNDLELPKDFFERLADGRVDIIFVGAGSHYKKYCLPVIRHFKLLPKYIIDNAPRKWGTDINGVSVKSADSLKAENKNDVYILVASMFYHEIREQLMEMGFEEHKNFAQWKDGLGLFTTYLVEYSQKR